MTEKFNREELVEIIRSVGDFISNINITNYYLYFSIEPEELFTALNQIKVLILQEEREKKEPSKEFLEKQRKILKRKKLPIFDEKGKEFMSLDLVFLKDNQIDSFVKELIQDWEKERRK